MKFDYLIVGAGYSGCVIAEQVARHLGKTSLIVECRDHIAGNAYDYYDDSDILVHKYGPHIFHTSSKKVWDYLSAFTQWSDYVHHAQAYIEGKNVPIPFNFNSIEQLFPSVYAKKLITRLLDTYSYGLKIPILKLKETTDSDLKFLADYIYKNVFLGYTTKQWGMKPEELDSTVTARVPVYLSRDNRYFQDTYCGLPKYGYTKMFQNLLSSNKIHLLLKTDYKDIIDSVKFDKIVYTGPIDYFFDSVHGHLPYRSLRFDLKTYDASIIQEVGQLNYPNNHDYTRITEFKHLTGQTINKTTLAYEYSMLHVPGENEPYYPIPRVENHEIFANYKNEAAKLRNVYFTGRLADYKYYNMDQTVGVALQFFEKYIAKSR